MFFSSVPSVPAAAALVSVRMATLGDMAKFKRLKVYAHICAKVRVKVCAKVCVKACAKLFAKVCARKCGYVR